MPASWEIISTADKKVLVAVLCPPDVNVSMDFSQNLRNLQLPPASDFMRVVGMPFGAARNQAAQTALNNNYNLFFLDADMRAPQDCVIKLQDTRLDIVGGLYYQRFHTPGLGYQPCAFNEARDPQGNVIKIPISNFNPGSIIPVTFLPSGLTYYSKKLLKEMFARYKSIFTWGVDLAPVLEPEGNQAAPFSEDFNASWKAKQLGFQPYVHTGVVGLHECRAVVGPKWLLPLPGSDPSTGVCAVV